jgi:hypothetical protein
MASELQQPTGNFAPLGYVRLKEPFFQESVSDNVSKLREGYVLSDFVKNVFKTDKVNKSIKYKKVVDKKGKIKYELARVPDELNKMCMDFLAWINDRRNKFIKLKGHWEDSGENADIILPYTHRWCKEYRDRVLAKLYYVMEYLGGKDCAAFMLTLTVPHKTISPVQCLTKLKIAQKKLTRKLRKMGYVDRVWFLDSHPKTGYPHLHMLVMGEIPAWRISQLTEWWTMEMGCTSQTYKYIREHGLNVRILNKDSNDSNYKGGKIFNVVSYLMKYLSKSFCLETEVDVKPHLLVFNATMWAYRANPNSKSKAGARLFGFTREMSLYVSEAMRKYKEELKRTAISAMLAAGLEPDTWIYDGIISIVDEKGNVISEVAKKKEEMKVVEKYLFTITEESLTWPVMWRLKYLVDSGYRILKSIGNGMVEVYKWTVLYGENVV